MGIHDLIGSTDPNDLPETQDYSPIDPGEYTAETVAAELKETKKGDGHYIKVEWLVTGPDHGGRKVWDNLNIDNPNDKAENIGRERLRAMVEAFELDKVPDDPANLVGYEATIGVVIDEGSGDYGPSNDITYVESSKGGADGAKDSGKSESFDDDEIPF